MYNPKYTITNQILKNIGAIEGARELILNAPLVPAWEARFQEEALIRTVHHGTHLEGNELDITEAAKVLAGQKINARERDIQEVINYRNVVSYIDKMAASANKKIDESVIKTIHRLATDRILPDQHCGGYRRTQVVVKNSLTGEVTFRPPTPLEIPQAVTDFLEWVDKGKEAHPVLKAGITQYELVRIHPFIDGNGRVARSLATLVLFLEGYDIRRFFSLEEYYDKDASRYYLALQSVRKVDDSWELTGWLEYFTEGLSIELSRIKEKVQRLSVDTHLKEKLGGKQIFLNQRQIKIVEYIQKNGYLQNQVFRELFPMISEDTILRELKDLVKKGLIRKRGKTKASKYVLKT